MPEASRSTYLGGTPVQLAQLEPRVRRRLIAGCALRITLTTALLIGLYYWLPLEGFGGKSTLAYFLASAAVFVCALAWQVRSILVANNPGLRAVEAVGLILPLFIVLFATAYVALAQSDPHNFSEPLNRTAGLYFTITMLSTVGFGDITPKSDATRVIVSVQMLLDLVIVGVILKLVVGAARTGIERQSSAGQDEPA